MAKTINRDQVIEMLKRRQGGRSMRTLATELGVSVAYISDLYKGRRHPGPAILKPLGLESETTTVVTHRYRKTA